MVTLHEVITFLVSMQISISSLQTHNVNRCGRSRHLARKLSLRRKRSSPNDFEMLANETITRIFFFFFQAEDGIRDVAVTGVQTCALPILQPDLAGARVDGDHRDVAGVGERAGRVERRACLEPVTQLLGEPVRLEVGQPRQLRSEERRVGKEGRSRWSPYH